MILSWMELIGCKVIPFALSSLFYDGGVAGLYQYELNMMGMERLH